MGTHLTIKLQEELLEASKPPRLEEIQQISQVIGEQKFLSFSHQVVKSSLLCADNNSFQPIECTKSYNMINNDSQSLTNSTSNQKTIVSLLNDIDVNQRLDE